MQLPRLPGAGHAVVLSLLALGLPAAALFDCKNILINRQHFDLGALKGPHSIVTSYPELSSSYINTTYTLDICAPLGRSKGKKKDEECPNGTRVCGIRRRIEQGDGDETKPGDDVVREVLPIAGDLAHYDGKAFETKVERLKTSDSNSDSQKEGLRLIMKGGAAPYNIPKSEKSEQQAIIEFICDRNRTGLEGEWKQDEGKEEKKEKEKGKGKEGEKDGKQRKRDGEDDKEDPPEQEEKQLLRENAALIFESYGWNDKNSRKMSLRLTWYTKYACENIADEANQANQHWGFFTWTFLLAFLGIATYLIFGAWLNYNRHGARGWDLLPHGDTIRDIPYLFKDWMRRVFNTFQGGGGSRGDYSAL